MSYSWETLPSRVKQQEQESRGKKITIVNFKGGVGKSLVAHQLITTFGYCGIEVDPYGSLSERLPDQVLRVELNESLPCLNENDKVVFDFGGFDDQKIVEAVNVSDLIIVPFIPTLETVQGTVDTLLKIVNLGKPILMIGNKCFKENDLAESLQVFNEIAKCELECFLIPDSVAFQSAINKNCSVFELFKGGGIASYSYRKANDIIQNLNKVIEAY